MKTLVATVTKEIEWPMLVAEDIPANDFGNEEPDLMDFSEALRLLKDRRKVQRVGWNGKGMWLMYVGIDHYHVNSIEDNIKVLPWIGMKTADGSFVPWLASQSDILSEDWLEVL